MKSVRQSIVVKKDLHLRRGEFASIIAAATVKFIFENNEAVKHNQLSLELDEAQAEWFMSGRPLNEVRVCDSSNELENLMLRANIEGMQACPVWHNDSLVCVAFGPANSEDLDVILGDLKLL
jgi:peptidyl-tRNA hydrolase